LPYPERGQRHDALRSHDPADDRGGGRVTFIRCALDHELRRRASVPSLNPYPRHIAGIEAALETRPESHHDRSAVRAAHAEEQTTSLRRRERVDGPPPKTRREPSEQQKRLRGMDVSAIHVNGEARAYARDLVEERPPGRNVEELRDELAPVG